MKVLRDYLDRSGETQQALAIRLNKSQATISRWLAGTQYPTVASLRLIAGKLKIPIEKLTSEMLLRK